MKAERNLHSLSACHSDHVNIVGVALFLHKSAQPVLNSLQCCLRSSRKILVEIGRVMVKFEEECNGTYNSEQCAKEKENIDLKMEGYLSKRKSRGTTAFCSSKKSLVECVNNFMVNP